MEKKKNFPASERDNRESGTVSIEFLLLMPTVALIIMFLLGLYILQKKHQALVASRFATQFQTVYSREPSSATLSKAVGDPKGRWTLNETRSPADSQGGLNGQIQQHDGLGFAGVFSTILNFVGGNNKLEYTASSNTFGGIIARMFRLDSAKAKYIVETDTWTCKGDDGSNRGSYLSIVVSKIPLVGGFLGGFLDISCCKTYESSKDQNIR